ncbi:hypothetical protein JX266_009461 [Neoarthrinium moseri]|nr:hypothetical protein JX266_009461 [Neoarthrinium moseri]
MATAAAQQSPVPSPTTVHPAQASGEFRGIPNGVNGHGAREGSGVSPLSQPPPPPPPAPMPGPAPPAYLQASPDLAQQPQAPPQHQPQPALLNRQPSMHQGKVAIVEPPGAGAHRTSSFSQSFGSPTRDHQRELPKFNEDVSRLTFAVQQSVPEAVRRVVRDNWEKSLLGTEFHQAFVMNAVIHHANGLIIRRAIRDFGRKMVSESKQELIGHFMAEDLDDVADRILDKASDHFLDKALDRRLATIDARSLINALARAERLGYENDDVVDMRPGPPAGTEPFPPSLMPETQGQGQYHHVNQAPRPTPDVIHRSPIAQNQPQARAQAPPYQSTQPLQCTQCWRKFLSVTPYEYHVKKQLCTKAPPSQAGFPFSCEHCGAGFVTNVGQQYHHANKVCGDHGTAPATPRGMPTAPSPAVESSANSPAAPPPGPSQTPQGPTVSAWRAANYAPSPSAAQTPQYEYTPSSASRGGPPPSTPSGADPYAHLTPQTRERMDEDLRRAEETYAPRFREAEAIQDPNERKLKIEAVQNSFSTKQSIIRKKYGVRLRQRRTRAEIEAERMRMHGRTDTPASKRQRTDDGHGGTPTYISSTQQPPSSMPAAPEPSPSKHLSVAEMNSSGLGGASATAAMMDPTVPGSQQASPPPSQGRSLSSMQRNGYRISTHTPRQSVSVQQSPQPHEVEPVSAGSRSSATVEPPPVPEPSGPTGAPIVVDDDSPSSDSDPDEEIPATVPPNRRAS